MTALEDKPLRSSRVAKMKNILKLGITNMLTRYIEVLHDQLQMNLPPGGGASDPMHTTHRYKVAAANLKIFKTWEIQSATCQSSILIS